MLKKALSLFLLLNFFSSLHALEIFINSADEEHERYSILHLKNKNNFLCQEIKDDFGVVTKIVCAFTKRPQVKIKKLQSDFFKIDTTIDKDTFFLIIIPHLQLKLIPVLFNLNVDNTIYQPNATMSNHWTIVGFKEKLPIIREKKKLEMSIDFPYYSDVNKFPYVGGLDLKGNPIHIEKVEDVTDYLKIKKFFKEKKYDKVMELIDEILDAYPNSLFKAEFLYYKMKAFNKLDNSESIIDISKIYLREYSSDENIPEVLSLTAKAHSNIGLNIDADYFFDRLFSEYEKSVFTQWGYIYKGEMLEESGGTKVAISFYEKALNETQNIDVAATAAYKLAHIHLAYSYEKSAEYIMKIIGAKPEFFNNDFKTSKNMMDTFAEREDYLTASEIAKALYEAVTMVSDDYEILVKDRALWLAKTIQTKKALKALSKYAKEFPDGDFINEIDVAKDAMFFDTEELNDSKKLQEYDKLIEEYNENATGKRATYEKAKLLLNMNKYYEVLDMKDEILNLDENEYKDLELIISDSVVGAMQESLKDKKCEDVLLLFNEYNQTLEKKWDNGMYMCAIKGGELELAKSIAFDNLKYEKFDLRKKWLYRYIQVEYKIGNNQKVIDASKDLIKLIEEDKKSPYLEVYRHIFDAYLRLDDTENMILFIIKIENIYGVSYKDLDRYVALMTLGNDRKDNVMIIKYGSIAYTIQVDTKSYPQSPLVEFTLYQAYIEQENFDKALKTIKSLDDVKLSKKRRARQKYLLGTVYSKLWRDEDASKAYEEAIKADFTSPWAKLAKSAKEI